MLNKVEEQVEKNDTGLQQRPPYRQSVAGIRSLHTRRRLHLALHIECSFDGPSQIRRFAFTPVMQEQPACAARLRNTWPSDKSEKR